MVKKLYYIQMSDPDFRRRLEHKKRENLGHVLLRSARLFDALGIAQFREESGLDWLTSSHLRLMPHIDLEGTRVSVVAERVGVSKQAVGQLVDPLVEAGLLEKTPDPDDARARLIGFSASGRAAIMQGLGALAKVEARCQDSLGKARLQRLLTDLAALLEVLETLSETES